VGPKHVTARFSGLVKVLSEVAKGGTTQDKFPLSPQCHTNPHSLSQTPTKSYMGGFPTLNTRNFTKISRPVPNVISRMKVGVNK
jgi:hypothetical protein